MHCFDTFTFPASSKLKISIQFRLAIALKSFDAIHLNELPQKLLSSAQKPKTLLDCRESFLLCLNHLFSEDNHLH
jgi:hypothetical protein